MIHVHNYNCLYRYSRVYSKVANHWSAVARKVPKDYLYVQDIMTLIVNKICQEGVVLRGKASVAMDAPRRIAPTIAPVMPPATRDIVDKKLSRFTKEST